MPRYQVEYEAEAYIYGVVETDADSLEDVQAGLQDLIQKQADNTIKFPTVGNLEEICIQAYPVIVGHEVEED